MRTRASPPAKVRWISIAQRTPEWALANEHMKPSPSDFTTFPKWVSTSFRTSAA